MFMPPLHVIDVPGHACHGVNGVLYHLEAILFLIKMFGNFLDKRQVSEQSQPHGSGPAPPQASSTWGEGLSYLEQQVVLEDALDRLQQVGAQRQGVL